MFPQIGGPQRQAAPDMKRMVGYRSIIAMTASEAPKRSSPPANSNMPPFIAGCLGRCPRCGAGKLYSGFLTLAPECTACGLDYTFIDAGDGPAVFVILVVGFIVMAAALVTEVKYRPPMWLHMSLWLPLVIVLSLGLLRPFKGALSALQFANKAREGRMDSPGRGSSADRADDA